MVHPGWMEFTTFPSKVTLCMMRNAVVGGCMQSDERDRGSGDTVDGSIWLCRHGINGSIAIDGGGNELPLKSTMTRGA